MQGSLINGVMNLRQGMSAGKMALQLGVDVGTVKRALHATMPVMIGVLQHNTPMAKGASTGLASCCANPAARAHWMRAAVFGRLLNSTHMTRL